MATDHATVDLSYGCETGATMQDRAERYDDDAATVRRVLAGDVDAFERIVVRWQGPLVNLAYRFCRDRGRAEEMAQEAFLKIFRGLGKWRRESRFSTWVFAVASNLYRSEIRRRQPPAIALEQMVKMPTGGNLESELDGGMLRQAVHHAVATLPPRYRDVVVLYYFHEMSLAETAASTNLRPGTVKARLHRARGLLERKLEGLLGGTQPQPDEA